jgi:hypothetical protein
MYADEPLIMYKHSGAEAIAQNNGMDLQEEVDAQNIAGNKMINFIDYVAPTLGFIHGYALKYIINHIDLEFYAPCAILAAFFIPLAVDLAVDLAIASKPFPQITDDLTLRTIKKIKSDQEKQEKEFGQQMLIYGTSVVVGAFVQSFAPQ